MKSLPALPVLTTLVLALLAPAAQAQADAAAPAASAASAPRFAVRQEVGNALKEAVELFRAGKVAEARDRVDQAMVSVKEPQPAESTAMHRMRGLFALQLGQAAEAVTSLQTALSIGAQNPADQQQCEEFLAVAQFSLKAYPAAVDAALKAQAGGSRSPRVQAVLVRATYLQNDYAGTIRLLEAQQQRDGQLPLEELRILASAYGQTKDDAKYVRLAERLLRDHGRTEYWNDLLSRVQRQEGWQARWDIDLYRLRLHLDMMDDAEDYLALADMAARAGLPAEALGVIDAGRTKGVVGKGPNAAEHDKLRTSVAGKADADRQALVAAAARPAEVGDAKAATRTFNTGVALVSVGQVERGIELMKAALEATTLPDAAQARLQYAQALHRGGRAADAVEQLKPVAGHQSLGLLARLWQIALAPKPGG